MHLATLGRIATDEWLMNKLVGTPNLGAALPSLTDAATDTLRRLDFRSATPEQRRVWRRLAIVGAGFVGLRHPEEQGRTAVPDSLHPFLAVVSNFYDPPGEWKRESDVRFSCTFQYLPEDEDLLLLAAGKALSQSMERTLKRSLRNCLAHSKSGWPAARLLARQIRAVWREDTAGTVGPNIMCMVLPRPRNPNQFSFSGSPVPLKGQELTELEVFKWSSAAPHGGPEIEKRYIYWPYNSAAFPYYQPNIVTSDGRQVKGGRMAPVERIAAEVFETAPVPLIVHPRRTQLP